MTLDQKLTKLALKLKNLMVLDFSFSGDSLKEFSSTYPKYYVHLPSHQGVALEMAAGMATLGKLVLILDSGHKECDLTDNTLNVKILQRSQDAVWDFFEDGLQAFGTGVLLIPEDE